MTADEMVITARLADHYEDHGVSENPLEDAKHDIAKFKKDAPRIWKHLMKSKMTSRKIGDWIYDFIAQWPRGESSFKNYAAEWADINLDQ